eukprot:3543713-Rhodomonas_salina.2
MSASTSSSRSASSSRSFLALGGLRRPVDKGDTMFVSAIPGRCVTIREIPAYMLPGHAYLASHVMPRILLTFLHRAPEAEARRDASQS